jgi:serine/threonine protein kinase
MVVKFAIQRKKNNRQQWEYCGFHETEIPRNAKLVHREYKVIRRLLAKPGPGSEHIIECFYSNSSRAHVDGIYYNAQEYGGDCLVDLVATGAWNIFKSYPILRQMTNVLSFIQKRGYVHHDVKPDNILLKNNQVKLIDFAGCLPIGASENLHIAVTPGYIPPEWNSKPRTAETDEKFDIYSLGVMFMLLRFPGTQTLWLDATEPVTELNLDFFLKYSKCGKQDRELLEGMLHHDYTKRWSLKKLQFMCDLIDLTRNQPKAKESKPAL